MSSWLSTSHTSSTILKSSLSSCLAAKLEKEGTVTLPYYYLVSTIEPKEKVNDYLDIIFSSLAASSLANHKGGFCGCRMHKWPSLLLRHEVKIALTSQELQWLLFASMELFWLMTYISLGVIANEPLCSCPDEAITKHSLNLKHISISDILKNFKNK